MFDPTVNPAVDPSGLAMMKLYPKSNVINTNTITNFSNVPVRSLDENEFDVRVDHTFSAKDSVFGRFSYDQATSFVPGGSPGFAEANAFGSSQTITNHGRNVAISETHIFSGRNINQFTFGYNRIFNHIRSFGDGTCEAANIGILGANLNSKCPECPSGGDDAVDQRLHELWHELHPDEQLLGAWGSRICSLPGRNQRIPDFGLVSTWFAASTTSRLAADSAISR